MSDCGQGLIGLDLRGSRRQHAPRGWRRGCGDAALAEVQDTGHRWVGLHAVCDDRGVIDWLERACLQCVRGRRV